MATVSDTRIFSAVYKAMSDAIFEGSAPTTMVQAGQRIVRASRRSFVVDGNNKPAYAKLRECLVVRDGGSDDGNANRFSGRSPDGSVNAGGVYFSMHNEPMFMELRHYNPDSSVVRALKNGVVLSIEVTAPLLVLDMSRHSGNAQQFLRSISRNPDVRAVAGMDSLYDQMMNPNDFSVSRAIGLAVGRHRYLDGMLVQTARTDPEQRSGDNLVLFGKKGQVVSKKLRIRSAVVFKMRKGPGQLDIETYHY
ncbi:MAG: hypothetical protein R3C59_00975 [Planctomycetaceae bacterium]